MWNTGKIDNTAVYWQRVDDCRYEVYQSDKIELIVRNAARSTTTYFHFDGNVARNQNKHVYDEAVVEQTVKGIPELDQLPEKIVRALLAVKKKETGKQPPTEPI